MAKSAKSPSNQLKEGRSTAGTACPSTGNPGSNLIIFLLFRVFQASFRSDALIVCSDSLNILVSQSSRDGKNHGKKMVFGACRQGELQGVFKGGFSGDIAVSVCRYILTQKNLMHKRENFSRKTVGGNYGSPFHHRPFFISSRNR